MRNRWRQSPVWHQGRIREQQWEKLLRALSIPPQNPLLVPAWEQWREQLLERLATRRDLLQAMLMRVTELERALSTTIIDQRAWHMSHFTSPEAARRIDIIEQKHD